MVKLLSVLDSGKLVYIGYKNTKQAICWLYNDSYVGASHIIVTIMLLHVIQNNSSEILKIFFGTLQNVTYLCNHLIYFLKVKCHFPER